jgi:phosphoglycolate phosphatase
MTESRPASHIIFDLDGTLVQTRVASWAVFQQVNAEFDLGIDVKEKYFALLNGNLFEQIRELCDGKEKADAVIESFMNKLGSDYFPVMIPGMVDVIHALAPTSTLAVLSSNRTSVIRRVLIGNGIEFCFAHVFGGDVEPNKTDGIRRFVADAAQGAGRRCSAFYDEGTDSVALGDDQTVLVTDTVGDVDAAAAAGVRAVGVSWGMHSAVQLTAAGAEFVAFWPQELLSYLRTTGSTESCLSAVEAPQSTGPGAVSAAIRRDRRQLVLTQRTRSTSPTPSPNEACGCLTPPLTSSPGITLINRQSAVPVRALDELIDAVERILG